MREQFERTALLLGEQAVEHLLECRVAVFGIGGVGGFAVEALARAGIGAIDLFDHDRVTLSNLNRQIIATRDTIGRRKVEIMKERILAINPDAKVTANPVFFLPENQDSFDFSVYDYVIDAIDTVSGKLSIITKAKEAEVPVISAMGAGNKLDPTRFKVTDIAKTKVCPLAKVMRRELKKRNIKDVKVVYSEEEPKFSGKIGDNGKPVPGSCSFVPSVAGLILAGEVIKDLIKV
ncbi:MAG: tRNA threonylcarbamoyladenosine dehydratase [Acetivibrio ethanolgignens]